MSRLNQTGFHVASALGALAVLWVATGFIGNAWLALTMTAAIGITYGLGIFELVQFRKTTTQLQQALANTDSVGTDLQHWLEQVPASLRNSVRLRIDGERVGLPAPALTPYLVGLLVMLGMLGTFLGMVVTFKGVVFALQGSGDLQAIRAALAEPIKGLGLSFGTSIAGVATSAMLGLMSAISRRERLEASRLLDTRIAHQLHRFSRAHRRDQANRALHAQSDALPKVADQLRSMVDHMAQQQQRLHEQLLDQQARFHQEAAKVYTDLASDVGQSLRESLKEASQFACEGLKPVLESAMAGIATESARAQQQLAAQTQGQLNDLTQSFATTAQTVSQGWTQALDAQTERNQHLLQGLERALQSIEQTQTQGALRLVESVQSAMATAQLTLAQSDTQRLAAWHEGLSAVTQELNTTWRQMSSQAMGEHESLCESMARSATAITEGVSEQAAETMAKMTHLLEQSQALTQARLTGEAQSSARHEQLLQDLTRTWRGEMAAMRHEESARADAAVARLGELQAAMATHLSTLGTALEAPMTRLIQTASDVPQAAAEVMAQLRQEMSRLSERDNQASTERQALNIQMRELLQSLQRDANDQRAAVERVTTTAMSSLNQAAQHHTETLAAQAHKATDVAAHVMGSALELASLGEAFQHGVERFSASNDRLTEGLQRIEDALCKSLARSDEQLAYYVAQAREVIDLSIASQQGIVEDMRRLQNKSTQSAEGAA